MTRPAIAGISRYFIEHAHSEGGGNNIVNVILVDFRGFDTLGEITVVATVALAVYALLRRFRPAPDSIALPPLQRDDVRPEPLSVPMLLMRLLFPMIGLVALFLLLRGHDLPGGGFVADLTMAVAFLVQYMAAGTRRVEARLRIHPVRWMGAGLLLAAAAGAGAWGFARPILTAYSLPLVATIALPSVLVFDAGVFALVVGATVLVLIALAHQSLRTHRAARPAEPEGR